MLGMGCVDSSVVFDLIGYSVKGWVCGSVVGVYGIWLQVVDGMQGVYVDVNLQYGCFDNWVQGIGLVLEYYDLCMVSVLLEIGYIFNVWQGVVSVLYVQL